MQQVRPPATTIHRFTGLAFLVTFLLWQLPLSQVWAAELNLYVQPIESQAKTERAFKPLAEYLSKKTGYKIDVKTASNFLTYWELMRRDAGFDLVLDAAHFTDYRDQHQGYQVLAKVPDTVSFSLVTNGNLLLFGPNELIGKSVASAPSPSLGGVRMEQIYPNPLRQPKLVPTNTFQQALDMLHHGKVVAALVPTPLVRGDVRVNTVMTTKPVPQMAFSASPNVSTKLKREIRRALLNAGNSPAGRIMLKKMHYARFQPADNAMYKGYENLLEGVWGYSNGD